jgi:hypothetical protein
MVDGLFSGAYPASRLQGLPQQGAHDYVHLMAGISKAQDLSQAYTPHTEDTFHPSDASRDDAVASAHANFGTLLASFMNDSREL